MSKEVISKNLKRLREVNLNDVTGFELYYIGKKMYCSKKFLALFYGVNEVAINKWEKVNGLKRSTKGHPKLILYDFDYVQKFREEMVGKSKGNVRDNKGYSKVKIQDEEDFNKVDLQKKKNEVTLQEYKIKEAKGSLVPSDVADKAIAEFGALFVGFLRNSRTTLSRDLVDMNQDQLFKFLDHHYQEFVHEVNSIVHSKTDEELKTIHESLQ